MENFDRRAGLLELGEEGCADHEQDEDGDEADCLHADSSVKSMVDEHGGQVISYKGATDIEDIPKPSSDNGGIWVNDFDE